MSRKAEDKFQIALEYHERSTLTLMDLPMPVRFSILDYLGESREDITNFQLVSKQCNEDCKESGIAYIGVFVINCGRGSTTDFVHNLNQLQLALSACILYNLYRTVI